LMEAATRLDQDGPEAIRSALSVPDPPAWLDEVEWLERSFDVTDDTQAQVDVACNLLQDFDDADLLCWFARSNGMPDPRLEQELDACRFRLAEQPDTFLPASVYIQAIGHLLRPDLADYDEHLATTAEKYVVLLDEFELLERDVALVDQPPLPQAMLAALRLRAARHAAVGVAEFSAEWPFPEPWFGQPQPALSLAAYDAPDARFADTLSYDAASGLSYYIIDWNLSGAMVAVFDGRQLVILYRCGGEEPPPGMICHKASQPDRDIEWLSSPVQDRLFRAELGVVDKPLTIRLVGDVPRRLTFKP